MPDVSDAALREERIAEIRRQIAAGTYETPERLAAAIEAFLESSDVSRPPRRARPTRMKPFGYG